MNALYWVIVVAGGFLLGSVMFCELIPKRFAGKDIYEISADNNPGAFNAFKHCGARVGIPCLLLDVAKGFIPVFTASMLLDCNGIAFSLAMAAPVLGHAVGLFNKLHGGKCIAVSFGVFLGIIPVSYISIVVLAGLYIFFSCVIKINPASTRSVIVYVLFAIISCTALGFMNLLYAAIGCGLVASQPVVKFLFSKNATVQDDLPDAVPEKE